MRTMIFGLLSLILFFTVCSKDESVNVEEQQIQNMNLTLKDGSNLKYSILLPKGFTAKKYPLLFSLHYGWNGTKPEYYGKTFIEDLIKPAVSDIECIVVAPDCPDNSWVSEKSVSSVLELLDWLKAKYSIDTNKILLTGFSLGGLGTGYIFANYPQIFTSSVIVSASLDSKSLINIGIRKFYAIHSTSDEYFPFADVQKEANLIKMKNPLFDLITLNGLSHYDVGKFQIPLKNCIISLLK